MYTPPPQDFRHVEQASRERHADLERTAARRAELGVQRPRMRETVRRWYRRLTQGKQAEL